MNGLPLFKDDLVFTAEDDSSTRVRKSEKWKVAVVDDDKSVHDVTRLALGDFEFDGKGLEFISAFSAAEAKDLLSENPDVSVLLLDVVMETDDAGLLFARYVREELKNRTTRIVLRTGQPGQAPEEQVITSYDINDYKEKTELTAKKLFTLMYASLRSYRDIMSLEANKKGLEKVIEATSNIFELQNMKQFTTGVLEQMTSLLNLEDNAAYMQADGIAAAHEGEDLTIVAAVGNYKKYIGVNAVSHMNEDTVKELIEAMKKQKALYREDRYTGFFKSRRGSENLIHFSGLDHLSELDHNLLEVFGKNIGVAFENIELHQDIEETQREIVYMLGEAVETRSKETGNHVKRVAEISKLLALDYGLDAEDAEVIRLAAPMHDLGKIGIPDHILNKPGKHTPEEWNTMQTHAVLGYDMLKNSKRRILRAGAVIARDHHEKWNGEGYPDGRKGEDIHLYGRIAAVADVFDALGASRCYKEAWPMDKIIDLFQKERGNHFEPRLVDGLMANMDKVTNIRERFAD
ncbi:MAG: DUF3369 domain-containing protein [Magnetovibrio sp.]|nr:DUF3369 domain-containing protein [Magnetovibrio sp.]